jgi:hypothetical protein
MAQIKNGRKVEKSVHSLRFYGGHWLSSSGLSMAPVCALQGRWGARVAVPWPVAEEFERRKPMARGAEAEHAENV